MERKIKVTETYTELAGKQQDLKDMRYMSFHGGKEKQMCSLMKDAVQIVFYHL